MAHRALCCIALMILTLSGPAAAELPQEEKWIRVRTEHFTVLTDATKRRARKFGRELERLRGVMGIISPAVRGEAPRPTYLYLFGHMREFWLYHPDARRGDYVAYSLPRERANFLTLRITSGMEALPILYEQYGHTLLAQTLPGLPLWVREGLSSFFSRFSTGSRQIHVGLLDEAAVQLLRGRALMPLTDLMQMTRGDPAYRQRQVRALFDAQAWGVVHYLITQRADRRQQFFQFIDLLRQGVEQADAFAQTFGASPETIFSEFYKAVQDRRFRFIELERSEERDRREGRAEFSEVGWPEALYWLGRLAAATGQPQLAAEHFEAAVEQGPELGWGRIGLGWTALESGDHATAVEHFRAATERQPRAEEAWLGLGRALFAPLRERQGWLDTWSEEERKSLLEARAAFERVIQLAPERGAAWADLGNTYFWNKQPVEGARRLEEAFQRMPSRRGLALNLLSLYATLGWEEKARLLIERGLQPIADAATLRRANQLLAAARQNAARERATTAEGDAGSS